jgi:LmbE family N-acetylglucosaminyl deacetylase
LVRLGWPGGDAGPATVLCLGAHADDIEIGCGGSILLLKNLFPQVRFHWVVFTGAGRRAQEAEKAAGMFTAGSEVKLVLKSFRDGYLPYMGGEVKDFFEQLKSQVNPDLIFTHWRGDAHQDHRLISELTWNTFRDHLILEYEIPKYDGDMGRPNMYLPFEVELAERKVDLLLESFESQRDKRWFDRRTFLGLMRLRGMESNAAGGYAEAFHAAKVVLHPYSGGEV